jgi:hypothetical protein
MRSSGQRWATLNRGRHSKRRDAMNAEKTTETEPLRSSRLCVLSPFTHADTAACRRGLICAGGTPENSPAFQRWVRAREGSKSRRDGRKAVRGSQPSLRDLAVQGADPSVETLGYSQMSLRDREPPMGVTIPLSGGLNDLISCMPAPVGQAFQPASEPGFPARRRSGRLESRPNRQPGKAALRRACELI